MTYRMLLFVMVLGSAVAARAAPATRPVTTAPAHEISPAITAFLKPLEANSQDDPIRQKLIEHHNTAVRLLELRVRGYRMGIYDVTSVFEAGRFVADAKMELATSAKEREGVLNQGLEVAKALESQLQAQFEKGLGSEADVLRARLAREHVEVELLKLKRGAAAPTTQPR